MSKLGKSLIKGAKESLAHTRKEKISAQVHNVTISKKIDVKTIRSRRNIGDEIIQSMKNAVEYMRGKKTLAVTHKIKLKGRKQLKSE